MHWLARVFVSAIARRIAYVLLALLLASAGIYEAHALDYPDQGAAWAGCLAQAGEAPTDKSYAKGACTLSTTTYNCAQKFIGSGSTGPRGCGLAFSPTRDSNHRFPTGKSCATRSAYTGVGPWSSGGAARNGSIGCKDGCDGVWSRNADSSMTWQGTGALCPENEKGTCDNYGDGFYWNAVLNVCEPPEGKCGGRPQNSLGQCAPEPCPDGMTLQADGTCKNKGNECPAGQIKSPAGNCLPGDGQCAQGEVHGKDGTCKKDSDGDGEPDEGEEGGEGPDGKKKDEFSGGDDCKTPPTCSGSPIMCGQARIQWRIDCNTRRNRNIAGGACTTPPICTGEKCDALEYSGLLMQWRSACALEKLSNGTGGNADTAAIRNALTGTGGNPDYGTTSPGNGAWQGGGNTTPGTPNTAGYGWGGSCPQPPAFEVLGQSFQFDITPVCNWLGLGSYFVLGLAALISLRIVASRDA